MSIGKYTCIVTIFVAVMATWSVGKHMHRNYQILMIRNEIIKQYLNRPAPVFYCRQHGHDFNWCKQIPRVT